MTPTLVYDGDCGFCTTSAGLARRIAPAVDVVAWQLTDLDALGVSADDAAAAVQFVAADGVVYGGAAAVGRLLLTASGVWRVLGRLLLVRGVRDAAAVAYRLVSRYRYRLPGGTPACRLPD